MPARCGNTIAIQLLTIFVFHGGKLLDDSSRILNVYKLERAICERGVITPTPLVTLPHHPFTLPFHPTLYLHPNTPLPYPFHPNPNPTTLHPNPTPHHPTP